MDNDTGYVRISDLVHAAKKLDAVSMLHKEAREYYEYAADCLRTVAENCKVEFPASVRAAALEEERAEFEAFAKEKMFDLDSGEYGYKSWPTMMAWQIWQDTRKSALALSAATAGGQVDPIIATWPAEIWLNVGDEPLAQFDEHSEITWCSTPQGEHDVRYVRAPIAAAQGEGK